MSSAAKRSASLVIGWLLRLIGPSVAGVVLFACCLSASAQVSISLPQSNIQNTTAYSTMVNSGTYSAGVGLGTTIKLAGSSPILLQTSTGSSFPVNNIGIQLSMIGGVNLFGATTAIQLSTTAQTIYSTVASLGGGAMQPVQLAYTIPTAGYAWAAGTYTSNFTYSLSGLNTGSVSGPGLLTINIPAYIVAPSSIPTLTLNVNSLSYYSTLTVGTNSSMAFSTTVPYKVAVNGNSSNFVYSNTLGLANPSNLSLTNMLANLNNGTNINLSGAAQNLNATAISVSAGNNQTQTLFFSISPASLASQFAQTGLYSVPITLTTSDARSSPTVTSQTTTSTLNVVVADMQAFTVNDQTTTINFNSTSSYQGITQAQPNHMTVSSTSPWGLSVSASASNLTNGGNTIPVSYVAVGNSAGESFLTTTSLSSVSQTIASSRPVVIAQTVGVNYAVSAANALVLINKPSGTYGVTVTYRLSAL